jgi:hypothetical protein
MATIKNILMTRDNMTEMEADELISEAKADLNDRLEHGDTISAYDICEEYFGLEPDYLMELM